MTDGVLCWTLLTDQEFFYLELNALSENIALHDRIFLTGGVQETLKTCTLMLHWQPLI